MGRVKDCLKIKGFVRLQMVDAKTGKVLGEPTPWIQNQVTNLGVQDYICAAIGNVSVGATSKQISYMAIGIGTVPGAAATTLDGETGARATTSNSVNSSKTLQMTCQFSGTAMGSTCTIQNVGLFNTSSGGTLCAGVVYATLMIYCGVERVVTFFEKLLKFGGHLLNETIPSQVRKVLKGVTIRGEAPAFAG